jgi:hypothetical protein
MDPAKEKRVNISEELRRIAFDDATFLSRVTASDESWIYAYLLLFIFIIY